MFLNKCSGDAPPQENIITHLQIIGIVDGDIFGAVGAVGDKRVIFTFDECAFEPNTGVATAVGAREIDFGVGGAVASQNNV